jgi:hypothetical protein
MTYFGQQLEAIIVRVTKGFVRGFLPFSSSFYKLQHTVDVGDIQIQHHMFEWTFFGSWCHTTYHQLLHDIIRDSFCFPLVCHGRPNRRAKFSCSSSAGTADCALDFFLIKRVIEFLLASIYFFLFLSRKRQLSWLGFTFHTQNYAHYFRTHSSFNNMLALLASISVTIFLCKYYIIMHMLRIY